MKIVSCTCIAWAAMSVGCGQAAERSGMTSTPEKTADSGQAAPVVQSLVDTPIVTTGTDSKLVNAWGLAFNPVGAAWVADNGTGVSTVYSATGAPPRLTVTIPPPAGAMPPSAPTGTVFNQDAADFLADKFLFATEDGTIAGWQSGDTAVLRVDNSASSAVYKGIAIANTTLLHPARIFAANFRAGTVDAFDADYKPVACSGRFVDHDLPSGFAPFNVMVVERSLVLVTYAKQNDAKHDDVAGPGNGFVNVFDLDGTRLARLISQGPLDSPWGMAIVPDAFGNLGDTLLVGNFGDGHIHAFQIARDSQQEMEQQGQEQSIRAELLGSVGDTQGAPLAIDGLWALQFGVDAGGFSSNTLYYTAGPVHETQGIFGMLALP